jgi:hypothetical protein
MNGSALAVLCLAAIHQPRVRLGGVPTGVKHVILYSGILNESYSLMMTLCQSCGPVLTCWMRRYGDRGILKHKETAHVAT